MRPTLSPWNPHAPRIAHPYLGKYEPSPVAVALGDPFSTGLFSGDTPLFVQALTPETPKTGQPPPDEKVKAEALARFGPTISAAQAILGADRVAWEERNDEWHPVFKNLTKSEYDALKASLPGSDYLPKWPTGLPDDRRTDARPLTGWSIPKYFGVDGWRYRLGDPGQGISLISEGYGWSEAVAGTIDMTGKVAKIAADSMSPQWLKDIEQAMHWAAVGGVVLIGLVFLGVVLPKD